MKKAIMTAAMVMVFSAAALAGTSKDVNMLVEIPAVFDLQWGISGALVDMTGMNAITPAEYVAGFREDINGGTLAATANANYDLTVRAASNFFFGGTGIKPTSDVLVDIAALGYVPLNGVNDVVLINNMPPEVNAWKDLLYKVFLTANDTAGIYDTTLTYTIKAHI